MGRCLPRTGDLALGTVRRSCSADAPDPLRSHCHSGIRFRVPGSGCRLWGSRSGVSSSIKPPCHEGSLRTAKRRSHRPVITTKHLDVAQHRIHSKRLELDWSRGQSSPTSSLGHGLYSSVLASDLADLSSLGRTCTGLRPRSCKLFNLTRSCSNPQHFRAPAQSAVERGLCWNPPRAGKIAVEATPNPKPWTQNPNGPVETRTGGRLASCASRAGARRYTSSSCRTSHWRFGYLNSGLWVTMV